MKIKRLIAIVLTLAILPFIPGGTAYGGALGTAFTYQGNLTQSGANVDQTCGFEFSLYDASSSGNQQGSTQTKSGVSVSKGLFSVSLDFGSSIFTGDERWLGISVRCPDSGDYTALSPRQSLTAAPYALYASGNWSLTGNVSTTAGTNFVGTTDSTALVFKTNSSEAMRIASGGNVGIGDTSPDDLLNISSASAEAALALTSLGTDTDAAIKFELADGTATFTMGVDDSDSDKFKISTTALGTNDRLVIDSSGALTVSGLITGSVAGNALTLANTTDNASVQVALLEGNRATPANNDEAYLSLQLSDDGGNQTEVARLSGVITDVDDTIATEDGRLTLDVLQGGTLREAVAIQSSSGGVLTTVFNDAGLDWDFTIEGDTATSLFFVDASADRIGIGNTSPDADLDIVSSGSFTGIVIDNTASGEGDPLLFFSLDGAVQFTMGVDDSDSDKFKIGTSAITTNTRLTMDSSGNVGIGDTTPTEAKLVVSGQGTASTVSYGFLTTAGTTGTVSNASVAYSIRSDGRIASSEFNAISDQRVKNIIGVSDTSEDLDTLNHLEVTDFAYIDVVSHGNAAHKKLIAQQVQEVYPEAVNSAFDFVPSVYEMSASTFYDPVSHLLTVTTDKRHGLFVADTVRIINQKGYSEGEVTAVSSAHTFTIPSDRDFDEVFVFGKQVDDFLLLDYEAIGMLNVSATQELAKRFESQQSQVEELQAQNNLLNGELCARDATYSWC